MDITDDDFFDFHIPVASLGQFFRSNLDSFPVLNQSIVANKKIKDKERSSERNEYKNKLRNFVEGNLEHLNEDDLDDFE